MPKLQTPWGPAYEVRRLDANDMILRAFAAENSGIGVHPQQALPDHIARCATVGEQGWRWFEDTVAAAAVVVAFPHLFSASMLELAVDTLKHELPEAYTAHFGEPLTAATSRALERRAFEDAAMDNFVVTAGFGSAYWNVPCGHVYACGFRRRDEATAGFLVPASRYLEPDRLILDEFPRWEPDRTLPMHKRAPDLEVAAAH